MKARSRLLAWNRPCPLLHAPAMPQVPLGYEAPAGCTVECSLGVPVLLDLGKRLPVVSACARPSHPLDARLGDKRSDKPRLRDHLTCR